MLVLCGGASCKKWVSVPPPLTQTLSTTVFSDVSSANAAVAGMYSYLYQLNNNQSAFGGYHLSLHTGVSADELYVPGNPSDPFFNNNLSKTNTDIEQIWSSGYSAIFSANAILEGIQQSKSIPIEEKAQFEGEALFIRAFVHFYLVNLFGSIPVILTTDVNATKDVGRIPVDSVYQQILKDCLKAKSILPDDYSVFNNERVRACKWAASAFLARVYLYLGRWEEAKTEASNTIAATNLFSLDNNLDRVFLKNGPEAILQFESFGGQGYTTVGNWLNSFSSNTPAFAMTNFLVKAFESGDERKNRWVKLYVQNNDSFYIPEKYKNSAGNISNSGEYDMVIRLAELYLIKSEAEANGASGGISDAINDLNTIRHRAGLSDYSGPVDPKDSILSAIHHERQVELFTEWGHRWLDLKRTGTIDKTFNSEKPQWDPNDALYPIPLSEIGNNPLLNQNPGY
jgi:hypothetical protein